MPRVTETYRTERRELILLAAARCFADRGFHMTSMDDVIAEAGLSAGAVYGYYKGKDELIQATAARAMELVAEAMPAVVQAGSPAELLERALGTVRDLAELTGFNPARIAVQAWGESLRNPGVRDIVAAGYREVRGQFAGAVRRWQGAGVVPADADADAVAQVLFGLVLGFVVQGLLLGDLRPDRYAAALEALGSGRSHPPAGIEPLRSMPPPAPVDLG